MTDEGEAALQDIYLVGPATAPVLDAADITPQDIKQRRVTQAELTDAGVNPGVAARMRRAHSLPWSGGGDGRDLDRRAAQIRGLNEAEQDWIAASASNWTETLDRDLPTTDDTTDQSPDSQREITREPVTVITGIGEVRATRLAEAGITSVRALAAADPETIASTLDLSRKRVQRWHTEAKNRHERQV